MVRWGWVVLVAAGLAGCVKAEPLRLPDGTMGQSISCPGMARTMADCYQKAGDVCPLGYEVVAADSTAQPARLATSSAAISGVAVNRALMVKCR